MKFCIFCNDNKKELPGKMTQLFNYETILVHLVWLFTFKTKDLFQNLNIPQYAILNSLKNTKEEKKKKQPTVYTFGSDSPQFKLPPSKLAAYLRIPKSQDAVLNSLNYELCSTLPQPQAQRAMNPILS